MHRYFSRHFPHTHFLSSSTTSNQSLKTSKNFDFYLSLVVNRRRKKHKKFSKKKSLIRTHSRYNPFCWPNTTTNFQFRYRRNNREKKHNHQTGCSSVKYSFTYLHFIINIDANNKMRKKRLCTALTAVATKVELTMKKQQQQQQRKVPSKWMCTENKSYNRMYCHYSIFHVCVWLFNVTCLCISVSECVAGVPFNEFCVLYYEIKI